MKRISKNTGTRSTVRLGAILLSASTAIAAALGAFAAPATAALEPDNVAPSLDAPVPRSLPAVGDCTNSTSWGPFVMKGGTVPCTEQHTGQTIFVGDWTSGVSPAKADSVSESRRGRVVEQLRWQIDQCDEARSEYLGIQIAPSIYRESQFYVYITGPNPQQWEAGERWLRCDIVAFKHPSDWAETANSWLSLPTRLQFLPPPAALKGILGRPDLGTFTNCQAQREGSGWYEMFSCKKGIEIVASVGLTRDFSSTDAARKHVQGQCVSVVKRITGKTVEKGDIVALSSGCAAVATSWVCGLRRD